MSEHEFEERPDACPLCKTEQTGLDFHHWDYENHTGCYLCRDCHMYIHRQGGGTHNSVWRIDCIKRLVTAHIEFRDGLDGVDDVTVGGVMDRYNMPDEDGFAVLAESGIEHAEGFTYERL